MNNNNNADNRRKTYEKIHLERSILLRTLHKEVGISCAELCRRYPQHSRRSIYRHGTSHGDTIDKRKHNKGRPKLMDARKERLTIRTLLRLRKERA